MSTELNNCPICGGAGGKQVGHGLLGPDWEECKACVGASPAAAVPEGALPPLPTEKLLRIIAENTGKRINLSLDDLDQYLSVARAAVEADRASQEKLLREKDGIIKAHQVVLAEREAEIAALRADRARQGEPVGERIALDARRHRYARMTTTAVRDPETGERIEVTPEMYDAAIDSAMESDPNFEKGIKAHDLRAATKAAAPADASSQQQEMVLRLAGAPAGQHGAGERARFEAWFSSWHDPNIGRVETGVQKRAAAQAWLARATIAAVETGEQPSYEEITKVIFARYPKIKGAYCASIAHGIIELIGNGAAPAPDTGIPTAGEVDGKPWADILDRAAWMLDIYEKHLYATKQPIEEHPYIPSIEEAAHEIREIIRQLNSGRAPVSTTHTSGEVEKAEPFGYYIVEGDDLPYPGAGFVRELTAGRQYRSVTALYTAPAEKSQRFQVVVDPWMSPEEARIAGASPSHQSEAKAGEDA